jgi:hypothetical protein
MVNFYWIAIHTLLRDLTGLIRVSANNMKLAPPTEPLGDADDKAAADQTIPLIKKCVEVAEERLAKLKSDHINDATKRLKNFLSQKFSWSELNTRGRALRDAIETELRGYLYYQYPKAKGEKLKTYKEDWKAPFAAFPTVTNEVFCAIDCYALGHDTASVFHSMRVAEHGLRSLARERRVKLPRNKQIEWATWQEIIKALDSEVVAINAKKAGAAKDAALEFYSGARADLNGFKDEYRNLVMHVRAFYDQHQSLRALTKVHAFIERLATKLDHKGSRIRWGLR